MSIIYNIRGQNLTDSISINEQIVNVRKVRMLIAHKMNILQSDISVINPLTNKEQLLHQIIRKGTTIIIQRKNSNRNEYNKSSMIEEQIIDMNQLRLMINNSRFYIIKSSNEENIMKARDQSIWATTYSNQERLKYAYNSVDNVLLLFATNRSYEVKGLARMQTQPSKMPDKSIWAGVSNIRLGGNFRIRWLRKKPLSFTKVEKQLGFQAKDQLLRACDGYEADIEMCKKISELFEMPTEPYYFKKYQPIMSENKQNITDLDEILGKQSINNPLNNCNKIFIAPHQMLLNSQIASLMFQSYPQIQPKSEQIVKEKKKKNKKKQLSLSSSSSSSSSDSSDSEDSYYKKKKINKKRRHKHHKYSYQEQKHLKKWHKKHRK